MLYLYQLAEKLGIWDVEGWAQQIEMPQFWAWVSYYEWKHEQEKKQQMEAKAALNRPSATEARRGMRGS